MQSLNEELNTINAELSRKVEELDRANNDLKNVFESTQIATVFLDRDLVIRSFTPAASMRISPSSRSMAVIARMDTFPELRASDRAPNALQPRCRFVSADRNRSQLL